MNPTLPPPGRRILVVGVSGSGKTTLARSLSQRLHIPHIELDVLHWRPHWQSTPTPELRKLLAQAIQREAWVVDGNYSRTQDITLARADTVVWLDYPLSVIMRQLLMRSLQRAIWREELWAGNRESLRQTFLSRDSILLWALQTYKRRRRQYEALQADPALAHLTFIRLQSPAEMRAWLAALANPLPNRKGLIPEKTDG